MPRWRTPPSFILGAALLASPFARPASGQQRCTVPVVGDTVRVETKVSRPSGAMGQESLQPYAFEGRLVEERDDSIFVAVGEGVEAADVGWRETRVLSLCTVAGSPGWDGMKKGLAWGVPIGMAAGWLFHEYFTHRGRDPDDPPSLEGDLGRGVLVGGVAFGLVGGLTGKVLGPRRWVSVAVDEGGPGLVIRASFGVGGSGR